MEAAVPSLKSFFDIFPFTDSTGEYPVTDVGALAVLQGCPLLQKTDIMLTAAISNELRVELSRRCNFKRLNLFSWRGMAEELRHRNGKAKAMLRVS
jgi:hypothetical protein